MSLALLSRDKQAMVRLMGHNKGRNNAKKRAKRRKKTERLALVKKKQQTSDEIRIGAGKRRSGSDLNF
jgi:hypothetical protein